jgi:hypothetical protein
MTTATFTQGKLQPCCADRKNLRLQLTLEALWKRLKRGISTRVCRVCGRRHIRLRAKPGNLAGVIHPLRTASKPRRV